MPPSSWFRVTPDRRSSSNARLKWTRTLTREQVSAVCDQHHVPAAPLKDVMEVLEDPHLKARGFLSAQETEAGTVNLPNSPMRYAGSGLRKLVPPPALGEHTEEVLQQWCGLDANAIADLRRTGAITPSPKG